jgi:hypothetical protein
MVCVTLYIIPQTDLSVGVLTVLLRGLDCGVAPSTLPVSSLLLPYAVVGEGHPSKRYTEWQVATSNAVKHNGFGTFSLQDPSGAPLATWVPPGCLLDPSWMQNQ